MARTIIEPFRIRSVEPLRLTTEAERRAALEAAGGNLFALDARDVLIDLLTDSGTGAMSVEQWAALMRGDESYAGSTSYARFRDAVQELTGLPHVVPTHQGRAAEHLLFDELGGTGLVVPNNTHFDTTRANVESTGSRAVDLPTADAADTSSAAPFKGDMDLETLERLLQAEGVRVPVVMVTITNNASGGQPVSLANLRGVRALCDRFGVPLFLDACRFAENAYLIQQREPGQGERSLRDIARDLFDLADGCTFSAKKEGMAHIGGFLACRDGELASRLRTTMVVTEGFPTYGGMAGRDLEAIALGLFEALEPDYQTYRHASIRYVVERLAAAGVPVVQPAGGHAVFLDAARFLEHLHWSSYPGQALAQELYLQGGVRSCEIGSVMLAQWDPDTGEELPARQELLRLAIPRRTYTQSHMDYLIEVILEVFERRAEVPGVAIDAAPRVLRHFTARFRRLGREEGLAVGAGA